MKASEMRHTILKISDIAAYVKGGHGKFTMESQISKRHITYSVHRPEAVNDPNNIPLWISHLSNDGEFYFIGTVWSKEMKFVLGKKATITENADSVKGIKWLLGFINRKMELPETMAFWHEGVCCVCGRELTNPESIERGIGPICFSKPVKFKKQRSYSYNN